MKKKVKNLAADRTMTLPGVPAKRGRPCTGNAMTSAERQKKFRNEHSLIKSSDRITVTVKALAKEFELTEAYVTRELLRFALCNKNWRAQGFPSQSVKQGVSND